MKILPLNQGHLEQALALFAECFFHDPYYAGAYSCEAAMRGDFRECFSCMLDNGDSRGAFEGERLAGMAMTFPLDRLDGHMKKELFGTEGPLLDMVEEDPSRTYLVALCVEERSRRRGIASALFDSVLAPGVRYVGDVTSPVSLRMCEERGFRTRAVDGIWTRAER